MPPSKKQPNKANEMINFYQHKDIQKHLPKSHNPHYEDHQISLPARIGIIGNSGSRKSSTLLNFLSKANDTFSHIYMCVKTPDEPLYAFLNDKLQGKNITFFTKLSELPPPKDLKKHGENTLLVIDDMCNEKNQEVVSEYFIFGRKLGITSVYISQSYFKIPKTTRLQFSHLMLLKLSSMRDLNMVMADYNLGLSKDEVKAIYKDATKTAGDFLKIDVNTADNNKRYSRNWTDFCRVEAD
jgi:hypothetical protein